MSASADQITLYYWGVPSGGRAGAVIRMMEERKVPFNHVSSRDEMATKVSAFGADGVNIAPPVIQDGTRCLSQSTACSFYIGKKLGFDKGVDDALAFQYLLDIVDWSENNIGKNNENAAALKKFLEGDGGKSRFSAISTAIHNNIKGPYFFGEEPSYVDFFFLQHMDARQDMFDKLKAATGKDFLAEFPKFAVLADGLRALDSYKASKYKPGEFSQEVLDAYVASK